MRVSACGGEKKRNDTLQQKVFFFFYSGPEERSTPSPQQEMEEASLGLVQTQQVQEIPRSHWSNTGHRYIFFFPLTDMHISIIYSAPD